jgi:hypothetical protein
LVEAEIRRTLLRQNENQFNQMAEVAKMLVQQGADIAGHSNQRSPVPLRAVPDKTPLKLQPKVLTDRLTAIEKELGLGSSGQPARTTHASFSLNSQPL